MRAAAYCWYRCYAANIRNVFFCCVHRLYDQSRPSVSPLLMDLASERIRQMTIFPQHDVDILRKICMIYSSCCWVGAVRSV